MKDARRMTFLAPFFAAGCVALLAECAALLTSCATVQRDIVVSPASGTDFARLDALAEEEAPLRSAPDPARLSAVKAEASSLRETQPLNPDYRARLAAISGDLALLASDRPSALKFLAAARDARGDDEWVYLLRSHLAADDPAAASILGEGIAKAAASDLLKAELGLVRFRQSRYREAVTAFDEVMDRLSQAWRGFYEPVRERSLALKEKQDAPRGAADYVGADPVSLLGLVVITQEGTDLLDGVTAGKTWAAGALFERLSGAGFFGPGALTPDTPTTREREAFFFWNLVATKEEDPTLLHLYSKRFASRAEAEAPVPDLPPDSWFFDAALGCVEREILSLPDGQNFRPEATVSGSEALRAARKAAE